MADQKISTLTGATTPLAGTEVLPIVQGGATVKATIANVVGAGTSPGSFTTLTASGEALLNSGPSSGQDSMRVRGLVGAASTCALYPGTVTPSATNFILSSNYLGQYTRVNADTFTNVGFAVAGADVATASPTAFTIVGNLVPSTAAKGVNFTANTPAAGMTSQLLNWYEEGTFTPGLAASGASFTYTQNSGRYTKVGNLVTVGARIIVSSASGGSGTISLTGLPFTAAGTVSGNNIGQQGIVGRSSGFAINTPSSLEVNASATTATLNYRATANGGTTALDFLDVGGSADFLFTVTYQAA